MSTVLPVYPYRKPPEIESGKTSRYPVVIVGAGLAGLTAEIGALQGELRLAHLRAHLRMRETLSDEQIAGFTTGLADGTLTNEAVFRSKGHGAHHHDRSLVAPRIPAS